MITDGSKLTIYTGESVEVGPILAGEALMSRLVDHRIRIAVLFWVEGFGINRRIHAVRFPDISTDLPLVMVAIDSHDRIREALDDVDRA